MAVSSEVNQARAAKEAIDIRAGSRGSHLDVVVCKRRVT